MIRASVIVDHAHGAKDTITLDETARHRRRVKMTSDNGLPFLLDLPEARLLRHGEGIVLDDGAVIEVRAKAELLYAVHGRDQHHLLELAWHVGNRHLSTEIRGDHLRIRRDHVIRDMLLGLGAEVKDLEAPFNPQGGAYHHHHAHSHES